MINRAFAIALVLFGATAAAPWIDYEHPMAPPPGIGPSDLSQRVVFTRFVHARDAHPHWKTRVAHYASLAGGLAGTEDDIDSGDDDIVAIAQGELHDAQGTFAGQSWAQNSNGEVVLRHGMHKLDSVDADVLRDPFRHPNDIALLGRTHDPDAYVVRVDPPQGRLKYVFLDPKTFAVVRTEANIDGRRYVTAYSDFRTTDGYSEAWHITQDDGHDTNHRDFTLSSVTYDAPVANGSFAIPVQSTPTILLAAPAIVSTNIIADRVIVTTHINGRTVNLQLDSGASGIVMDRAILDALHVDTIGNAVGTTAGEYSVGHAVIPKIAFGDIEMHNVVVASLPFEQMADRDTPVAGLLGFDFIDSVVLHVDYANKRVEALDPRTFKPPNGFSRIPITLDNQVPIVSASVGQATGDLFIVDTGADSSALFTPFTSAHPDAISDRGLGHAIEAAFPFSQHFMGVGGLVSITMAQVSDFRFGGNAFDRWLFELTHNAGAFEGDFDGLIGQDVLRYFDVYFDYPHQAMYIKPNQRNIDRFGT